MWSKESTTCHWIRTHSSKSCVSLICWKSAIQTSNVYLLYTMNNLFGEHLMNSKVDLIKKLVKINLQLSIVVCFSMSPLMVDFYNMTLMPFLGTFRNNLSTSDMLTLYQYLVQTLLPKQVEKEIQGGAVAAAQSHGRFISPPEGIRTKEDLDRVMKVHLKLEDETEMREYYLIVYRTLSATVSFTVDG